MALLGQAALAMWWDIAPEQRAEFGHWHSHEHFPERMAIPGFLRGTRWADAGGGEGFFVMYELEHYATLTSPGYLDSLNRPSAWSTRMMPHHRGMVRSQCRVVHSTGMGLGGHAMTLRLSPAQGRAERLQAHLAGPAAAFAGEPGGVALHLLRTDTPQMAATTEQRIRGDADGAADWIVVAVGCEPQALRTLREGALSDAALASAGALEGPVAGFYALAHTATPRDLTAR